MEIRKVAPYRWLAVERVWLEGEPFLRDGVARISIHVRTEDGKDFSGATVAPDAEAMGEAEFDAYAERFLRENERAVLKHLAWAMRGEGDGR